jgi:hypothetical protein
VERDRIAALPLPADDLLACAWQRWEVEVAHRAWKDTLPSSTDGQTSGDRAF